MNEEQYRLIDIIDWKGLIVKKYDGNLYLILDTNVFHSETNERMVLYKALYGDCKVYIMSATEFVGKCNSDVYGQEYVFEKVKITSSHFIEDEVKDGDLK